MICIKKLKPIWEQMRKSILETLEQLKHLQMKMEL